MKSSIISLAALCAGFVAADFQIFVGGTVATSDVDLFFFNNPPNCDDGDNAVGITSPSDGDASGGGYACDGCTGALADYNITRLEFFDADDGNGGTPITSGALGHITLYQDRNYDISWVSLDGKSSGVAGNCVRDNSQDLECATLSAVKAFQCTSDLTVVTRADGGYAGN